MSRPDDPWRDLPPLVPSNGLFEGQVAIVGETRIAGTVRGSLRGPGELRLDPGSRIEGIVECAVLKSHGAIIGPVTVRQRAHLAAGTRMEGDLDAPTIEVDDDALWSGIARVGC